MSRNVLITGGAGGLGKEIALMLLKQGHSVIILDRAPKQSVPGEYLAQLYDYLQVDLADLDMLRQILDDFKAKQVRIDILIANAAPRVFKHFKDFTNQEIIQLTHASFTAHAIIINGLLPSMLHHNFGRIVTIGSKSGVLGYSSGSMYCSFKSALITFHESLEKELESYERNVTITTICPGSFSDTHGRPLSQYGFIVHHLKKQILKAICSKYSRLLFVAPISVKFGIAYQHIRKLVRIF